jgi:hypothetical protein
MALVTAAAITIWCLRVAAAWCTYRNQAVFHASEAAALYTELAPALEFERQFGYLPGCGISRPYLKSKVEQAQWHATMRRKYEDAAARPWSPVAPDAPFVAETE